MQKYYLLAKRLAALYHARQLEEKLKKKIPKIYILLKKIFRALTSNKILSEL